MLYPITDDTEKIKEVRRGSNMKPDSKKIRDSRTYHFFNFMFCHCLFYHSCVFLFFVLFCVFILEFGFHWIESCVILSCVLLNSVSVLCEGISTDASIRFNWIGPILRRRETKVHDDFYNALGVDVFGWREKGENRCPWWVPFIQSIYTAPIAWRKNKQNLAIPRRHSPLIDIVNNSQSRIPYSSSEAEQRDEANSEIRYVTTIKSERDQMTDMHACVHTISFDFCFPSRLLLFYYLRFSYHFLLYWSASLYFGTL